MNKKKKIITIIILIIVCIGIQIGYAFLGETLTINGMGSIANAEWSIHFANPSVQNGSVTNVTQSPTINNTGDTISYSIVLNKPGDYYEFTVDVVNDGSIDGEIELIESTINGNPISSLPEYLSYSVKYLDDTDIEPGYLLPAGGMDIYKVHIEYKKDISASQLPQEQQEISLSLSNSFKQKTSSARRKNLNAVIYAYNTSKVKSGDYYLKVGRYYANYTSAIDDTEQPILLKYYVTEGNIYNIKLILVKNNIEYELKYGWVTDSEWSTGAIEGALGTYPSYLECGSYYYLEKDGYTFFMDKEGTWIYLKNNVNGFGCYGDSEGAYCGHLPDRNVCTNG